MAMMAKLDEIASKYKTGGPEMSEVSELTDILSGNYRDGNGKRAWFWKDRIARADSLLDRISGMEPGIKENYQSALTEISDVIDKARYVRRHHVSEAGYLSDKMRKGIFPAQIQLAATSVEPTETSLYKRVYNGLGDFVSRNRKKVIGAAVGLGVIGAVLLGLSLHSCYTAHVDQRTGQDYSVVCPVCELNEKPLMGNTEKSDVTEDRGRAFDENINGPVTVNRGENIVSSKPGTGEENPGYTVRIVEKGDTLWDISEEYLKGLGLEETNAVIYRVTDRIAEANGKDRQSEWPLGVWDKRSPHYIVPGDQIIIPDDVVHPRFDHFLIYQATR